eukprot:CAMPEP_0203906812 /NCGR_PEP_ID=MMETSP0359-20131031/48390_1 /ASSEMBLY_ACC=CAM_ASM_000338 /TAXON_ID=268821 /ORGANISM="Scrippsiella Hangoei, Strain SHTV-5" /LENGTH=201 /DNA_ID=CAMNT_0050831517 /DNA_START=177 /DNA_END=779 /DNA_ORIENTATION=+
MQTFYPQWVAKPTSLASSDIGTCSGDPTGSRSCSLGEAPLPPSVLSVDEVVRSFTSSGQSRPPIYNDEAPHSVSAEVLQATTRGLYPRASTDVQQSNSASERNSEPKLLPSTPATVADRSRSIASSPKSEPYDFSTELHLRASSIVGNESLSSTPPIGPPPGRECTPSGRHGEQVQSTDAASHSEQTKTACSGSSLYARGA